MKSIIVVLTLLAAPAAAQSSFFFSLPPILELPTTTPWVSTEGKILGTATFSDGKVYLRNPKGAHVATVVTTGKGLKYFDQHGKEIEATKDWVR